MIRKNTLIILAVIIIVIIGLAIALMLADTSFFNSNLNKDSKTDITGDINQPEFNTNQLPESKPEEILPVITQTEQSITTVARNFAERFGSFSTDSNHANLEEVKLLSSAKLSAQLDNLINNSSESEDYYGVSSKVLKVKIDDLNETSGIAQITVMLQREETDNQNNKMVFYQDLELSLISSGDKWLVDGFKWQPLD